MERKRIYLCLAHMSEDGVEQKYVKEAFDTNWVVPLGPNVNGFEKDLEEFVGQNKRVVALSAGTAAVHLSLLACGVGRGDEVCVNLSGRYTGVHRLGARDMEHGSGTAGEGYYRPQGEDW